MATKPPRSTHGKPKIAVVGSINCDLTCLVAEFPRSNQTVAATGSALAVGGKGLNQAVAAACAGADVELIACTGEDQFAALALGFLEQKAVGRRYITQVPNVLTGTASILVSQSGENMIVVAKGANEKLTPAQVDAAESFLADAHALIVQLEVPQATVHRALELARKHGVLAILNPSPVSADIKSLLPLADIVVPNETETESLAGLYPRDDKTTRDGLAALRQLGVRLPIITRGALGSGALDGDTAILIPAFQVKTVDPTGAGDVFAGALATALATGQDLRDALVFATGASALSVMRLGAAVSAPAREEILAFLRAQGQGALADRLERC